MKNKTRILKMEILPYSLHYVNERMKMGVSKWSKFAVEIKDKAKWQCSICGKDLSLNHNNLHLHEQWVLDERKLTVKIDKFIPLCYLCHAWKHLGFMGIQIKKGWLTQKELDKHYIKTNNISVSEMKQDRHNLQKWWILNKDKKYVYMGVKK